MAEIIKTLVEMGFDLKKSELAVAKTNARDVQEAMEWLLENQDLEMEDTAVSSEVQEAEVTNTQENASAPNAQENPTPSNAQENATSLNAQESATTPNSDECSALLDTQASTTSTAEAKSLKCDECGKLFKTQLEVEFHAAKSGHSSFSESSEEKKPLTEEEKQAQKARLEELMQHKRKEREEKEKLEAFEREKNRIRSGKEMTEAKRKQEEQEIKKLVDQRKREKQEERLARQRVKEQIEQDKLARKLKFPHHDATNVVPPTTQTLSSPTSLSPSVSSSKSYAEAKLQIRLTNGSTLTQTFGAKEPLSAVRLYVEMNRTDASGPFSLMTSFPRKTFNMEDYDKPLDLLGLAPSAVIIVTKS